MDGEGSLCTDPPPLSKNRRRGPSPISTEERGAVCTQAMGRAAIIKFSLVNCNNVVNCNNSCRGNNWAMVIL